MNHGGAVNPKQCFQICRPQTTLEDRSGKEKQRYVNDTRAEGTSAVLKAVSQAQKQGGGETEVIQLVTKVVEQNRYLPEPPDPLLRTSPRICSFVAVAPKRALGCLMRPDARCRMHDIRYLRV